MLTARKHNSISLRSVTACSKVN